MSVAVAVEARQAILRYCYQTNCNVSRVRPVNPTWRLSQWMQEPSLPVRSRLATPGCAIPDNRQHILVMFQATVEKLGDWRHGSKIAIPSLYTSMWGGFETILTRNTTTARAQLLKHKTSPLSVLGIVQSIG